MDKKDLEQIKQVVREEVIGGFGQVWENNLEPVLNQIQTQMVTKTFLTDKVADMEGGLITKLRKEDEKVNKLAEILREKDVISDNDIKELGNLVVFPK
ncbi:MAG: hypothetical protein A3I07_02350 [Candidatus Doudnabacteria bacterium RIFCSPLOWO2_02_FULL_42_9]|uniref:Uncharacterized protein n=1 Tax=Candidatus Doudnabacteria bacterium RIFCSPHIGHO2_01_FULL_41_86 TaxID=1817821 RepID=A0A1F5N7Z0_9BACT|nr:MAG: hypothetical protein A2717_04105 [Candidatus Doudnabacteria bacterium RIFCSPHIGHO2_01_FULL_41_86]OGE75289.1 MAG: hypothetical protein A3K07_00640 [Candidatus Doudnabacteria bacterium RIFCSPHIGHO2_01_43_10]OGE85815.1 MAG: hypothetical protein A3E28_03450 [Candidatus Doudnabacteria bacterium RIFCSPHIGHO2_12_FULL_42_22]OGE87309.1 MAG: hypothetical protein A3C49_01070 [Candidatus Doudnabacteria bacterium RIFCSPHIGHO2_02_FULL_42_25]OGE92147.1 MAG: hypothetical protein A2895_00945 [Candidatus